MALLQEVCKTCNKPIKGIQTEIPHGGFITYVWNCGHIEAKPKPKLQPKIENNIWAAAPTKEFKVPEPTHEELYDNLERWVNEGGSYKKTREQELAEERWQRFQNQSLHSIDNSGYHAYEYQFDCVEFVERAKLRALIGDGMGVGKTIEACLAIKRSLTEVRPVLILVPSSIIFQWTNKVRQWIAHRINTVMPVISRDHLMPGFDIYVMSRDLLSRKGVIDKVLKLGIKCIIADECQGYKDPDSERAKSLVRLMKELDIKYFLPLSGTWIKNRVSEGWLMLNLLDPLHFPSLTAFQKRYLVKNEKGIYTRLDPYMAEEFKRVTSQYMIRREKHQVLLNLPPLTRDYQLIDIEDEGIKDTYNHTLGLFQSFLDNASTEITSTQLLGWLAKLRAITGMAKVQYAVDWINEFFESTEDESIGIAIHHNDVRETLFSVFKANGLDPLSISGADNSYRKNQVVKEFNKSTKRPLIINALAGGVGLDGLQSCANALVLEREWNSADEEQFESRFHRDGQKQAVTVTYMIARGTIDEFFHDMVFEKRNILAAAGVGDFDEDTNSLRSLKEFAEFVAAHKI